MWKLPVGWVEFFVPAALQLQEACHRSYICIICYHISKYLCTQQGERVVEVLEVNQSNRLLRFSTVVETSLAILLA